MKTEADKCAFGYDGPDNWARGLTKREYFAALMMGAAMSSTNGGAFSPLELARIGRDCADALILVLNRERE